MLKVLIFNLTTLFFIACANNSNHTKENKGYDIINPNIENFNFSKKYSNQLIKQKVKNLINLMLKASTARKAYSDLENLGRTATPYIIMEMEDYHELPLKSISLRNKNKDSFEGIRHIKVEVVADVLSEILTQLEGEKFVYVANDEKTNKDRRRDIYQWKLWLYQLSRHRDIGVYH